MDQLLPPKGMVQPRVRLVIQAVRGDIMIVPIRRRAEERVLHERLDIRTKR